MSDLDSMTSVGALSEFDTVQRAWLRDVLDGALGSTSEVAALAHIVGRVAGRLSADVSPMMILAFGAALDRWHGAPEEEAAPDIVDEVEAPRMRATRGDHDPLTEVEFYYRVTCYVCGGRESLCRDECTQTDYASPLVAFKSYWSRLGEHGDPDPLDVESLRRGVTFGRRGLSVVRMYRAAT